MSGTYKYEIIFRSGYDVIDGMATYALLDNLMRHAAYAFECKDGDIDVLFGDEYKDLFPPFRVALGLPPATFDTLARARVDAIRDQRIKDRAGSLSFPCKRGVSVPGKTHRAVVAFTVEESKAVLAACKLRETTATPVFHSAIALAVRDLQPRETSSREGKYASYVISNLRKYCEPPCNGPQHAMMTCHANSAASLVVHLNIPSNTTPRTKQCPSEFHRVLQQVQAFYNSCKDATLDDLLDAALCWTARTLEWPTEPCPIPAPTSSPIISLSSRGVTDNFTDTQYGPFQVLDPWAVGTELSPGLGVSLATWQGVMVLASCVQ